MSTGLGRAAACALILLAQARAAPTVRGFRSGMSEPEVLAADVDDLVVEQVWEWQRDTEGIKTGFAELGPVVHMKWVPGLGGKLTQQLVTVHKNGVIRLYDSVDADPHTEFTEVLSMQDVVDSDADHGMLGFEFHPDFATQKVKTAFVMYSGNPQGKLPNAKAVAPLRPKGWGAAGFEWQNDFCPNLSDDPTVPNGNNLGGKICEKVYKIDRLIVDLEGPAPTFTKDITIFEGTCGSSSTHGPGTVTIIDGALVFCMGEGAQYEQVEPEYLPPALQAYNGVDFGYPAIDGCYDPTQPDIPQGIFRSQLDTFAAGKVMLIPPELLDSKVTIPFEQVKVLTKGNRNPFRIFYREKDDTLFIGDIGQGDGGTTERIFKAPGISKIAAAPKAKPYNWGWPCIEGLYQNSMFVGTDEYKLYDALSEVQRQEYLQAEYGDDNVCGPVYTAATDYTNGDLPSKYADAMWKPPIFEYRTGALDPNHSGVCMGDTSAAVTSVHVYDGLDLPEALQGKLIFSDKIIGCMWYFDTDKDGQPTNLNSPHALMTASNIIDMQEGPDGALYLVHFDDQINRITRMYAAGMGPAKGVDTPPPTNAPTAAPFAAPEVPVAETCFAPDNMPELEWTEQADGSFSGTLELSAVEMVKGGGTIVTRGFNGMVPGPVIRMQACNTYKLRLVNDQAGWPAGLNADQIGGVNGFHDPTVTNLHLHGLHISGMAPGDSMDTLLEAGEMNVYTYTIPCEHASGTFWYHPHGHGSTALQADGGAAGMLIVEGAPRESAKFPPAYNAMPEQLLVVQDINTDLLGRLAGYSGDSLFSKSPMMKPFTMVNGCDPADAPADVALAAGQWTKLRMLNVGTQYNSVLSIVPAVPAADPCDVQLLAKDGVWLSDAPRVITPLDNAINFKLPANALSLFFSLSSRVDVAIRCPAAGMHKIVQQRINDPSCLPGCLKDTYQHPTIATITVGAAAGAPAPALPKLKPCRPGYLMDIVPTAATEQVDLTIRVDGFSVNNLPGALYTGVADAAPMTTMTLGQPYQWVIDGSANHPFHAHVNHMMLSVDIQPWDQVQANWHMPGDWLDSISVQGQAPVLIRPDHFSGPMVMHCHIAAHADMGLMGFSTIEGKDVVAEDWGTC